MKKILFPVLCAAAAIPAQENYATAWSGHTNVIVHSAAAGILAPVVRFPLLVRLDSTHAAIFNQARPGGADLRFTKPDNVTRLPHQVESWNAAARTAAIWVLADTIPPHRTNFALRLHWGNASAADSSSGAQVFDTTNHFQAVWHMSGSGNETDATPNGFTAAQNGTPSSVAAVAGSGRTVSSGNYFRATGTASGKLNFPEGSRYTISAWVLASSLAGHGTVVSKHDRAYALKLNADATNWEFFEYGTAITAEGWNWVNAPAFDHAGVWKHLVGVRSPLDIALYVDGMRMDAGFSTAGSTTGRLETVSVTIGAQPTSNTAVQRPFNGILDEVRMASTDRSEDWIRLEYETQKRGSAVVFLSDTVPASLARARAPRAGFAVQPSGDGLLFRVDAAGASRARVSVRDLRGRIVWDRVSEVHGGLLSWDGRAAGGRPAPQGVYAVRIVLLDAQGHTLRTAEQRVPFTR